MINIANGEELSKKAARFELRESKIGGKISHIACNQENCNDHNKSVLIEKIPDPNVLSIKIAFYGLPGNLMAKMRMGH